MGASLFNAGVPAHAQEGSSGVTFATSAIPHVPIAPRLPKAATVTTSVLDSVLLGGAIDRIRMQQALQAASAYQAKLADFLQGLTPEQYRAVTADPAQSEALFRGLIYLQTMRTYYGGGGRDASPSSPTSAAASTSSFGQPTAPEGIQVYTPGECVGPIVNGVCNGSILPSTGYHPTCHGTMLNGQCTGPMF